MTTTTHHTGRELAHRSTAGMNMTLLWDEAGGELTVIAFDSRTEELFEIPARPDKALDVFSHPFAYAVDRAGSADEPALAA